ncbi:hypothetical protein FB382_002787 [Nocardioides ginsengisegetis]|uniref:Uncharacterized protein n=1 Tax=Nocardioides ginsengisegetis TaxID=661491 RepID=A0A7W3J1F7_9ACTN|nr:hypothetical protein [Nocardioides ginsengisegetis]MBA8804496.1 hypothetical protein [Nocardioides ginsengisegetis]
MLHVQDPTSLKSLRVSVYSTDAGVQGQGVVTYVQPGLDGVWRGKVFVPAQASQGWRVVNAAGLTYQWRHYTDGVADQDAANQGIAGFITAHGGDGSGAWLGFAYGCDGNPFYLDGLQVETAKSSKTYDFEAFATSTKFENDKKTPKKITIIAGKRLPLTAELRKRFEGTGMAGQLKIQSRKLSEKKWGTVARPKVGSSGNYDFKVRPFVSSALKLSYAGTTAYEASSRLLTILVRPFVTGGFVNATVTKGHSFTLRGRILPARHAGITLQRWAGTHWVSIKKGSTGNDGRYSIGAVSTKVGRSYWRITVAPGGGNIAGKSPWQKLKTVAPPTGGGGTPPPPPPSDDPPPPPADDPPPPPPPTH